MEEKMDGSFFLTMAIGERQWVFFQVKGSSFVQMEEVDGSYSVAFKEEVHVFIFLVKCCSGVFVPEKEWRPTSVWMFLSREGNFAMTVGRTFCLV
ncbi:hypothetical protein AAC387_Pa03g0392 [Persea americana]